MAADGGPFEFFDQVSSVFRKSRNLEERERGLKRLREGENGQKSNFWPYIGPQERRRFQLKRVRVFCHTRIRNSRGRPKTRVNPFLVE